MSRRQSVASYIISSAWKMSSIIVALFQSCPLGAYLVFQSDGRLKANRAKRFYSLLCLLLRLTNRITDKWTVVYLSVHVFSTKLLVEYTIFASHTGDGMYILCSHLSHAKVKLFAAGQRQFLHFSVISRPWVWFGPGIQPATYRSSCQLKVPFRLSSLLASSPGRSSARAPRKAC